MNKEISIWKCKEHGEFETKTKNVPKCPVCKSAKLTFIRNKEIKLRVGGNYWENKANIILNDVELKLIAMPLGIVTKRNSVDFVCCNCREEKEKMKIKFEETKMSFDKFREELIRMHEEDNNKHALQWFLNDIFEQAEINMVCKSKIKEVIDLLQASRITTFTDEQRDDLLVKAMKILINEMKRDSIIEVKNATNKSKKCKTTI